MIVLALLFGAIWFVFLSSDHGALERGLWVSGGLAAFYVILDII